MGLYSVELYQQDCIVELREKLSLTMMIFNNIISISNFNNIHNLCDENEFYPIHSFNNNVTGGHLHEFKKKKTKKVIIIVIMNDIGSKKINTVKTIFCTD